MKCPRCQHENRSGAKFCEECAALLARTCTNCRSQLSPSAKFCSECAHPADHADLSTSQRFRTPDAYTPQHLAEKILTSKASLEGERKHVTILFADLKGSMELLADRDPEEARKILDPVLERMMEAVHRYEGTVNQVMGDGIMALFGAPVAHEDHAVRACYAALRMQDAVERHAQRLPRDEGRPLEIRVGLNSGEVVVRSIGSDLRTDYTAVGATTHLAARMEQLAAPGSILMTASTYALAEGYLQCHSHGPTTIKGLTAPVTVYELAGASDLRTRFQTSLSRELSHFVGRDTALSELRSALERAAGGLGQVVAVLGEPGVGKSRLLYEFIHSTDRRDWLTLQGGAFSYAQTTPYLPLIEVLKAYFQIEDRDDAAKIGERVATRLVGDNAARTLLSPILGLLGVPVDDASWVGLDPFERRQRMLDASRHILLQESRVQPVLVILEDLHWADSETQAFLDALVETLANARILLLVNYRPEYRHGWGSKMHYREVQLAPLQREHADALLASLLGSDPSLAPLTALLIEKTEGNPLFLEECLRGFVESNALVGQRGAYRLAASASHLRVPASVHAIIAARIDRLAPDDKALLQVAAVIGKTISWTLLNAVAGLSEAELHAVLGRLQSANFIVEGQLLPDLEYTFRHVLMHDVAYASLLQERRRSLHGQVVGAMERLYQHRLTEHAEALGHHAMQGQRWKEAVTYLRLAADKARGQSAHRQPIVHLEQALTALTHLPESRERDEQGVDLRIDLRQSLHILGDQARNAAVLAEAEHLAEGLGDAGRLGRISLYIGDSKRQVGGDLAEARRCYARARALGEKVDDAGLRTIATQYLGIGAHLAGEYRTSVELFREAGEGEFEEVRTAGGSAVATLAINTAWLARSLVILGEFEEATASARHAIAAAEKAGSPYSMVHTTFALGEAYHQRGAFADALPPLERAVAIANQWSIGLLTAQVSSSLGAAYARAGRIDEGLDLLRIASAEVSEESSRNYPVVMRLLGEVHMLVGDPTEARACAERALQAAVSLGQRGDEAWAGWLLGCTANTADAAEDAFQGALDLGSTLGMRPLVAHCHLGLGKLYRRTGRAQEAQERITTATKMYREMAMRWWLDQAEAEMSRQSISSVSTT